MRLEKKGNQIGKQNNCYMDKYYYLSKQIFNSWVEDLESGYLEQASPSQSVIDAIIDYSMMEEVYSETLDGKISICLN